MKTDHFSEGMKMAKFMAYKPGSDPIKAVASCIAELMGDKKAFVKTLLGVLGGLSLEIQMRDERLKAILDELEIKIDEVSH